MHRYKVNITPNALQDLSNIYDYIYIELCNPSSAKSLTTRIKDKCNSLAFFPKRSSTKYLIDGIEYQTTRVKKYTIIYTIDEESSTVCIRAIKYSRMNIRKEISNAISED